MSCCYFAVVVVVESLVRSSYLLFFAFHFVLLTSYIVVGRYLLIIKYAYFIVETNSYLGKGSIESWVLVDFLFLWEKNDGKNGAIPSLVLLPQVP